MSENYSVGFLCCLVKTLSEVISGIFSENPFKFSQTTTNHDLLAYILPWLWFLLLFLFEVSTHALCCLHLLWLVWVSNFVFVLQLYLYNECLVFINRVIKVIRLLKRDSSAVIMFRAFNSLLDSLWWRANT